MARSALSGCWKETKPKPRLRPLSRSTMMRHETISPKGAKNCTEQESKRARKRASEVRRQAAACACTRARVAAEMMTRREECERRGEAKGEARRGGGAGRRLPVASLFCHQRSRARTHAPGRAPWSSCCSGCGRRRGCCAAGPAPRAPAGWPACAEDGEGAGRGGEGGEGAGQEAGQCAPVRASARCRCCLPLLSLPSLARTRAR